MPDTIKLTVGRPLTSLVTPEAQPRFPMAENVCCAFDKHKHNVQFFHNGNTISSGGQCHRACACCSHCQAFACSDGWLSAGSVCRVWSRSSPASLPAFEPWKPGAPLSFSSYLHRRFVSSQVAIHVIMFTEPYSSSNRFFKQSRRCLFDQLSCGLSEVNPWANVWIRTDSWSGFRKLLG